MCCITKENIRLKKADEMHLKQLIFLCNNSALPGALSEAWAHCMQHNPWTSIHKAEQVNNSSDRFTEAIIHIKMHLTWIVIFQIAGTAIVYVGHVCSDQPNRSLKDCCLPGRAALFCHSGPCLLSANQSKGRSRSKVKELYTAKQHVWAASLISMYF